MFYCFTLFLKFMSVSVFYNIIIVFAYIFFFFYSKTEAPTIKLGNPEPKLVI